MDRCGKDWLGKALEAKRTGDLKGHPMCLEKHWKQECIPLFLPGDAGAYLNGDTILVYSWGPMIGDMASLKQQWAAAFPNSCTNKSTWGPIWKWLKWSFEALGKGLHPTHDPWGKPLEKGSKLLGKAGLPLHPKQAFIYFGFTGGPGILL